MDVRVLDLAVIIYHLMQEEEHLDAERTLAKLRQLLNVNVYLDKEAVESALFSTRLVEEKGAFKHPDGLSFWGMVNRLTPKGQTYNKDYSCFEEK